MEWKRKDEKCRIEFEDVKSMWKIVIFAYSWCEASTDRRSCAAAGLGHRIVSSQGSSAGKGRR